MNNKDLCIDETSPVVDAMEIKACLDAWITDVVELFFEVYTIFLHGTEEEHTCIKAKDTIFRIGIDQILTLPSLEFIVEILHGF